MEKVVGNCGKHPGFSMINCPMCKIERSKSESRDAYPAKPDEGSGLVWLSKKVNKEMLLRVFKKVSLFDLSECQFEYGDGDEPDKDGWTNIEDGKWINAMSGGRVVDAIKWDGNIFWMMNNDGSMSPLNPQLSALVEAGIISAPTDNGKEAKEDDTMAQQDILWEEIQGIVEDISPYNALKYIKATFILSARP